MPVGHQPEEITMNRKRLYMLLASPILVFAIYMVVLPSSTRSTFITEFKHRTALMFGYDLSPAPEDKGLRSDHPEEYGPQPGNESTEEAAAPDGEEGDPSNQNADGSAVK